MTAIDTNTTIGQLVAQRPSRARVFERLGIDYCCGGKTPLGTACAARGLDAETVMGALHDEDAGGATGDERDWAQATLTELAEHIVATHHAYLGRELPRLAALTTRVHKVHGARHAELAQVREVFDGLSGELAAHMRKEEFILFPLIAQMEAAQSAEPSHCGTVRNPIRVMEMEHDSAGNALAELRRLTSDYTPPVDACGSYRALLSGFAELEADLHQHIHKENNILFPRAVQLETRLNAGL